MLGWSDRHGFRGSEVVSPLLPDTVFCPRTKSIVAWCAASASPTTSVHWQGDKLGLAASEHAIQVKRRAD